MLREIGTIGFDAVGKLILSDLQHFYQLPDPTYEFIVRHNVGIFLLDFRFDKYHTIVWLYYHIFVAAKVRKEFQISYYFRYIFYF